MISGFMLYALWMVLIAIGLNVLLGLYQAVVTHTFNITTFTNFLTTGVLYSILPLLILNYLMVYDPTGLVVMIFYYAAAIALFIKYMKDLAVKLK